MKPSDYEKFQQRMFDEMSDLEHVADERMLIDFIEEARRCGIDVAAEISKKQRPVSEVIAEVRRKQQEK